MIGPFVELTAKPWTRLPDALHYSGEPNEWVRVTRPGQRLHSFLEGPCFDADGALWLVDVPYGRLFRIDDGEWTLAHAYDGEPHGLAAAPGGGLLIADYRHGLLRFDPTGGEVQTLCARVNTEPFRGLADVAVAPNGDVWMTDPGRSSLSDPTGRLYRLRAGSASPDLVLANLPYPNSVALAPGGTHVCVSVTRANAVWRLLADAPDPGWPMVGTYLQLSGGLGPDGLAIDSRGRLALAQAQAGRAWLFDALGDPIARIRVPEGRWTTAVRFTPDERALMIVEAETGTIYRADLDQLETSR
jgi:gluconolactonase